MKNIFLVLFTILILFSCEKPIPPCLEVNKTLLQGKWENQNNYAFAGWSNNLEFYNDSFKLKMYEYTDAIDITCNKSSWTNYVKGTFNLVNNNLNLDGKYCDENYSILKDFSCTYIKDTTGFSITFKEIQLCQDTLTFNVAHKNEWKGFVKN